jgi:two-component system vancomycin resistance associated response regulator VraR
LVIYDAYVLALRGIEESVKEIPGVELVGAFTEEEDLCNCLQRESVDIVIINMMLKSSQGLTLIETVKKIREETKIIVFADFVDDKVLKRALELGVNAFLGKDTMENELNACITSVAKGNYIIPGSVFKDNDNDLLTDMEVKILSMIADEYTNEQIAKELFISKRTVDTHVANICRKLGVEGRVGSVREGLRLKLVE